VGGLWERQTLAHRSLRSHLTAHTTHTTATAATAATNAATNNPPPLPPAPLQIYNTSRTENLKATAASTLSRLLRNSGPLVTYLLDKFGVRVVTGGLGDPSSKVQVRAGACRCQVPDA
jgi:hypothetical protein